MSTDASRQYQTQQIMTASPATLVYMLYDKAIGCLREAARAAEAGDVEARWRANGRAMEIVEHLRMTLNMEAGGEIARNLDSIYGLVLRELPGVDLRNDPTPAHAAIRLLEPLRESWKALADRGEEATRQAAQAARKNTAAQTVPKGGEAPPRPRSPSGGDGATPSRRIILSA